MPANMKPRKKISSLNGATTTISTPAAIAPNVPSSTPSSRVTSSCSGASSAATIRIAQPM